MPLVRLEDTVARNAALAEQEMQRRLANLKHFDLAEVPLLALTLVERFREAWGRGVSEVYAHQLMDADEETVSVEQVAVFASDLNRALIEHIGDDNFKLHVIHEPDSDRVWVRLSL